jgi:hypothetical protein
MGLDIIFQIGRPHIPPLKVGKVLPAYISERWWNRSNACVEKNYMGLGRMVFILGVGGF